MKLKIQLGLKRFFDLFFSLLLVVIIFVIPIYEIVCLLIKLTSKGPVHYSQIRIGKDQKPFKIYKFRTMIVEQYDENGDEIMSEDRITKIGAILRKLSLDELPQLFNIVNGTMSFIGPRPMLDYQLERCYPEELKRFDMRPGITGLAQVKGRNNIQWPERIQYDLKYINGYSLWLDIKILVLTVTTVFSHKGTEVKTEYRGVDRFSKFYNPDTDGKK